MMKTNGNALKPEAYAQAAAFTQKIAETASRCILGKDSQIRLALCCLIARGHLLIEDIPGTGKTTLAKALARILGLEFRRVQCTSDMLPGDILGVSIFDQKSGAFNFHPGPIFTRILLADEVNRTTPKTQSALLEAMEEYQVSLDGETRPLPQPFWLIATQNPLEQAGTYPLPESQLDRFLFRISLGYPDKEAEEQLLAHGGPTWNGELDRISPLAGAEQVILLQKAAETVNLSATLAAYVRALLAFSRESGRFNVGLSTRAGLAILRAARAWALMQGRDFALPEDVQAILPYVAGHRLRSSDTLVEPEAELLAQAFSSVAIPL